MKVISKKISEIFQDPSNERSHPEKNMDALKGSLTKYGQQKPIVVDEKGIILAGNGTYAAAKSLGWEKIDVVISDLKGLDKAGYRIADNRTSELAEWDTDALEETLKALAEEDYGLSDIGFDESFDFGDDEEKEPSKKTDDAESDDNAETPAPYSIQADPNRVKIIQGDSLEKLKTIKENSIDSLVTDPPAGISFMGKKWDADNGGSKEWITWLESIMIEVKRVLKPGAHGLVWAIPRTSHWTATALEQAGFEIRDVITHLFGSGFPKASALNHQLKGVFCQCASNKHNNERKNLLQYEGARNDRDHVLIGDVSQSLNDSRSKNKSSSSQGDCLEGHDLCGESSQAFLKGDSTFSQQQEYAQEHNHSNETLGGHDSGSLHNPSQVQCNDRLSNQDCSSRNSPSKNKNANKISDDSDSIQNDNDQKISNNNHTSRLQSTFPFPCSTCGKPDPKGFYNGGLKPSSEHWILIRKPISEKSIAQNVLKHGTGGINIDGSRVGNEDTRSKTGNRGDLKIFDRLRSGYIAGSNKGRFPSNTVLTHHAECELVGKEKVEDWNCHPECPVFLLDEQSGVSTSAVRKIKDGGGTANRVGGGFTDSGGASRFFYCAKASKSDKNIGTEDLITWEGQDQNLVDRMERLNLQLKDTLEDTVQSLKDIEWSTILYGKNIEEKLEKDIRYTISMVIKLITGFQTLKKSHPSNIKDFIRDAIKTMKENGLSHAKCVENINIFKKNIIDKKMEYHLDVSLALVKNNLNIIEKGRRGNIHSTVKNTNLMKYFIKLITPPKGVVLDCFMGSGSTGVAAVLVDFDFIGIEKEKEYFEIAKSRLGL